MELQSAMRYAAYGGARLLLERLVVGAQQRGALLLAQPLRREARHHLLLLLHLRQDSRGSMREYA
tara:strand:+ start:655 stop:849 length:195 start_codon:yes stop_codon:yes gene_type:complete